MSTNERDFKRRGPKMSWVNGNKNTWMKSVSNAQSGSRNDNKTLTKRIEQNSRNTVIEQIGSFMYEG